MHFHMQSEEFFLLEDLIAIQAVMYFALVVDETVNSKLLAHFKSSGAFCARKFLRIDHLILVNETSVGIAGCGVGEETCAD